MGMYLNPTVKGFQISRNSNPYVDKSGLIGVANRLIDTERRLVCVTRPRRFGKTMALNMLSAYYQCSVPSLNLFADLDVATDDTFETHLNRYNVVSVSMTDFFNLFETKSADDALDLLASEVIRELEDEFEGADFAGCRELASYFDQASRQSGRRFVLLIDEWDCPFRMFENDHAGHAKYLEFLCNLLEKTSCFALVYMTGIIPVTALDRNHRLGMFTEFSMANAGRLAPFTGFTEDEVQEICRNTGTDYERCRSWYCGYRLGCGGTVINIFNPVSVIHAAARHYLDGYWGQTETFDAIKRFILLGLDGLPGKVLSLIAGCKVAIDINAFHGMSDMQGADEVLALCVHLGYLGYDRDSKEVFIPNRDVLLEFEKSIRYVREWADVCGIIESSGDVLKSLIDGATGPLDGHLETALRAVDRFGFDEAAALECAIRLAFHKAGRDFSVTSETSADEGCAILTLTPRAFCAAGTPAMAIEMRRNGCRKANTQQTDGCLRATFTGEAIGGIIAVPVRFSIDEVSNHAG